MRSVFSKYICAFTLLFCLMLTSAYYEVNAQGDIQNAQTITSGQSVTDSLSTPVEVDVYKLTAGSSGYVDISFNAPASGEWKISLTDGQNEIYSRSSADKSVRIGVKSGVYYIVITPVKYSAENYTLTAAVTASDSWEQEFNDGRATAGTLSAGASVTGNLSSTMDIDCYSFTLTEPRYVTLRFSTAASQNNAAWALTVLDENNGEVIYSSLSKTADTEETVLKAGSYLAEITAINHSAADYTLKLDVSDEVIVTRLEGKSRIQTAIEISCEGWKSGTTDAVVLASARNYPDALAGVSLAYALDAPILLTDGETLESEVISEIKRLGAKNAYILGGEVVIKSAVAKALEQNGCKVERIFGAGRFETAAAIANKLKIIVGTPNEVFFACSDNYPDALAISGIAAIKGCPVLYIAPDGKLSDAAASFIKASSVKNATILGGNVAISSAAEGNIKKAGIGTVTRIAGSSRYGTCLEINKKYAGILTGRMICVATGENYPDALAGGVLAAANKAPLFLVGSSLTADQKQYISGVNASCVYVFGGKVAVSDEIVKQIRDCA